MAVAHVGIGQQLVKELRAQVTLLEADLVARATDVAEFAETLRAEYDAAREAERTAAGFTQWREGRITQAAAAWVLGTVFVRFCEDNGLIEWPFIAGPGERLADAEDRHGRFFVENPTLNDRDWLIAAFRHLSDAHPTAGGLFDERHNPAVGADPVVRGGHRADQVLAPVRRCGPHPARLHRPGHPLPRRPLPGSLRGGPQDLRAAADTRARPGHRSEGTSTASSRSTAPCAGRDGRAPSQPARPGMPWIRRDSEQSIRVDLGLVEEQPTKIVIAAALAGDATFGDLGAISLSIDGDLITAASATLDAATTERTMLLAEIYRRDGSWRLRAIGQGYDDGLVELATRYGVDIADG